MTAITPTATEVLPGSDGTFETLTAATAITAGQWVYRTTAGTLNVADANVTAAISVLGIALNGGAAGQPIQVQKTGTVTIGATAAMTVAVPYFLSSTVGQMAPASDLAQNDYVSYLGTCSTATAMILNIHNTGVKKL